MKQYSHTSSNKHQSKSLFDTLKSFQKSIKNEFYWQRLYLKQLKEQSEQLKDFHQEYYYQLFSQNNEFERFKDGLRNGKKGLQAKKKND